MVLTNPGAISNSGSKPFSNQMGAIAMMDFNLVENGDMIYKFINKVQDKVIPSPQGVEPDIRIELAKQRANGKYYKFSKC